MKVECTRDKFKECVMQVGKISARNLSLPILESILIEAKDRVLILKATNLDIGMEVRMPAKVEKAGITTLPADILSAFLSGLTGDQLIKIELVNNNLSLSTARNSTIIKSLSADDFPIIPKIEEGSRFSIEAHKLVAGIKSVVYAAALSDMKPEISAVYIYTEGGDLIFAATDSFRLAEKKVQGQLKDTMSIILPFKNANEIARIFEQNNDVLDVRLSKNQISIFSPTIYFTSRVVGGVFPDYRQIIPKEKKTEVTVLKKDLIDSIKISNIFSDRLNQINIKVNPEDSLFEISSRNQDKGESATTVQAVIEGESVDVTVNAKYVLDCLPFVLSDSVHVIFNGRDRPIMMRGVGDSSFLCLVMPMNV